MISTIAYAAFQLGEAKFLIRSFIEVGRILHRTDKSEQDAVYDLG
ncbi:hypothetical protein [Membranihabitans marinus]|nr:hypothetical protein [Membranihabitans marinus]